MSLNHALGESLTSIPRMGYLHPPFMVGGAAHGASCNTHAVALIYSMTLSDDPFSLE